MVLQDLVQVHSAALKITLKINYDPCYISELVTASKNFDYNFVYMISPKTINII